jgi:NTP pyrophosphatase (non-canonical NTP hydrolase)
MAKHPGRVVKHLGTGIYRNMPTPKLVNELQRMVAEYCDKANRSLSLPNRALDVCGETGELAQEVLRDTDYGKRRIVKVSKRAVAEFGDSLFSLLCMANEMDVDIEKVLKSTLEKYERQRRGSL